MENDPSRSPQDTQPPSSELADQVVDELLPEDLDWRYLVRTYPFPVVLLAVVTGFFLGRHRGHLLLSALGGFAMHQATENIASVLEQSGIFTPAEKPRAPSQDESA